MRDLAWVPAWQIGRALYYANRLGIFCWCGWCRKHFIARGRDPVKLSFIDRVTLGGLP